MISSNCYLSFIWSVPLVCISLGLERALPVGEVHSLCFQPEKENREMRIGTSELTVLSREVHHETQDWSYSTPSTKASHQSQLSGSPVLVATLMDASCLVMWRWRKVPKSQFRVGNNNPKVARDLHLSLQRRAFVKHIIWTRYASNSFLLQYLLDFWNKTKRGSQVVCPSLHLQLVTTCQCPCPRWAPKEAKMWDLENPETLS